MSGVDFDLSDIARSLHTIATSDRTVDAIAGEIEATNALLGGIVAELGRLNDNIEKLAGSNVVPLKAKKRASGGGS